MPPGHFLKSQGPEQENNLSIFRLQHRPEVPEELVGSRFLGPSLVSPVHQLQQRAWVVCLYSEHVPSQGVLMQVVGGRRPDPWERPRGQVAGLLSPWLPTGLSRAQRAEVLQTSGRGAHSRGLLLCLPVSCVGVRADTGGSLGGGDASSTFQAGS